MSLAAVISASGITAPTYTEILDSLLASFRAIYGADAYLEADGQDYQMIAAFAQAVNDCNQATIDAYNSFSPTYAQGVGLANLVKINGIEKDVSSHSSVVIQAGGQVGTVITGGIVQDENKNLWDVPNLVIGSGGVTTVTAVARQLGAISAPAGTVNTIYTPTLGWQTVTNPFDAELGQPIETDPQLRLRQTTAAATPSQTNDEAIYAAVANVSGVVSVALFDNDTDTTDSNGITDHTIALVVDGGNATDIAQAIASRKPSGIPTQGTTSITVFDKRGVPALINFYELVHVPIAVTVTLRALPGYLSTTGTLILAAIAQYLNTLGAGKFSYQSGLYSPADLNGDAALIASAAINAALTPPKPGFTQAQLDALSATYHVLSISQSRAGSPVFTEVTGGPYNAGAVAAGVLDTSDIYTTSQIAFTLDNATLLNVTVSGIVSSTVDFAPAVPGGRQILNGANVYLLSDLKVLFYEAAQAGVVALNLV